MLSLSLPAFTFCNAGGAFPLPDRSCRQISHDTNLICYCFVDSVAEAIVADRAIDLSGSHAAAERVQKDMLRFVTLSQLGRAKDALRQRSYAPSGTGDQIIYQKHLAVGVRKLNAQTSPCRTLPTLSDFL